MLSFDRSDSYHPLFRRLFSSPPELVTSAVVTAEGQGWSLRRYDRNRAIWFLNFIGDLPVLALQALNGEELKKTSRLVKRFSDQPLTLADAHGLVITNKRRISTCWSTDQHLGITGATLSIESVDTQVLWLC